MFDLKNKLSSFFTLLFVHGRVKKQILLINSQQDKNKAGVTTVSLTVHHNSIKQEDTISMDERSVSCVL